MRNKCYPMNRAKSFGLKSLTSAIPRWAITWNSLPKMYTNPTRIKPSAISAVVLSLAKSRTRASGKKTINCTRRKYLTGISVAQFVIPETKPWSERRLVSEWMDVRLSIYLEILRNENHVGSYETELRNYNWPQNEIAHPWSVQNSTNV